MSCQEDLPIIECDSIGDTVYSKKWLINSLQKTIQYFRTLPPISEDQYNNDHDEDVEEQNHQSTHFDDIEEQLCIIWDISSNVDVQHFLLENSGPEIFISCALGTNSPRLKEICIGILANCAHNSEILLILANTDIPLLIQLVRLVDTTVHNQSQWYELIIDNKCEFFTNVQHLFENCLNQDLLRLLFQLINHLLYKYDDLGALWLREDKENQLISSLCQACLHLISTIDDGSDETPIHSSLPSSSKYEFFYHFWFIKQMLYSSEWRTIFTEKLIDLQELFRRYSHFECGIENSLLSYCAACQFFLDMYECVNKTPAEDTHEMTTLEASLKSMMNDTTIADTHRRTMDVCASNDGPMRHQLQSSLQCLDEFNHRLCWKGQ
ncbi:Protein saal1 [Blomia tropicalis]|nr:Protein saal1 [Blomia tropicalis]